jgi:hypothetical protein
MLAALFSLLVAADGPSAQASTTKEAPPLTFGTPTDMVWTSGTSIRFSATAPMLPSRPAAAVANNASDFSGEASFALAIDYFLVKHLSVGAFVRAGYSWSPTVYGPGFGVGPRLGYHMAFSDWVGLWPRLDLSFGAQGSTMRDPAASPANATVWFFNATMNLPLVFSILKHVVLGIGPYFAFEPQWIAGQGDLSAFALNFGVSSFFGWHF